MELATKVALIIFKREIRWPGGGGGDLWWIDGLGTVLNP